MKYNKDDDDNDRMREVVTNSLYTPTELKFLNVGPMVVCQPI